MNTNSAQVQVAAEAAPAIAVVAPVVSIKPINYTQAQLAAYLESQRTGVMLAGKAFDQKVSQTNFTDADRQAITDARFNRRATLAHGEKKAQELALVRQKHITLTKRVENPSGTRIVMGFHDTKRQAEIDAAKKASKPAKASKK